MEDAWLKRWDERYREKTYAYGTAPNEFLKEQLQGLQPGSILFGAEGEGRNAVHAAVLGWEVHAFDISVEGRKKALALADTQQVSINYQVGLLPDLGYPDEEFDVIALIYAHFPPNIRSQYHALLDKKLKKGGTLILEAFGKNHLSYRDKNPQVGGPPDLASLFSVEELRSDFHMYSITELLEKEVVLDEGDYHKGIGSVTRFVGTKR